MGTKAEPGPFDGYAKARPDEPIFVLLGRDPYAAALVELWAELRAAHDGVDLRTEEARAVAETMKSYCAKFGRPALPRASATVFAVRQLRQDWRVAQDKVIRLEERLRALEEPSERGER